MDLIVRPYDRSESEAWNAFVAASKNGTFLLNRGYMDYHADRFEDRSYVVESGGQIIALLPANARDGALYSHQGLSYGGFIVSDTMTTPVMLDIFSAARKRWRADGFKRVEYKTIPSIYCALPSEEDRYALFREDARLFRRDVLCVLWPEGRPKMQGRRKRGAKKAQKAGVNVEQSQSFAAYWDVVTQNLSEKYDARPVHSLEEIEKLQKAFPENILLFEARLDGDVVAGSVIYESERVSHVQYIASTASGRDSGALDILFTTLLDRAAERNLIFDFGISNEEQGRVLNQGLIEQKEGFGGRAIVHDFYELEP